MKGIAWKSVAKIQCISVNSKYFYTFLYPLAPEGALGARRVLVECAVGASDSRPKWRSQTGGGRAEPAAREGERERAERAESTQPQRSKARTRRREKERPNEPNEQGRGSGHGRPPPAPPTGAPTSAGGTHPPQTHRNTHRAAHRGDSTDTVGKIPLPYYLTAGGARRAHRERIQT